MKCRRCKEPAEVALPSKHTGFCRPCYFQHFQGQVEKAIRKQKMFAAEDRILVAVSGGKDSMALFHLLLDMGYDVTALHIDLGIPGSSENAMATVEKFVEGLGGRLIVHSMADEGLPIPLVKKLTNRPVCSVCGSVKRFYFNKLTRDGGFDVSLTGHNLDDEVGRLFANTIRWDLSYLATQAPLLPADRGHARKAKPLYRLSEFETAAYCFMKGVEYWSNPCPFSKGASFPVRKELINKLDAESPGSKLSFYLEFLRHGRPALQVGYEAALASRESNENEQAVEVKPCAGCGEPTGADHCVICRLKREKEKQTDVVERYCQRN